MTRAKEGAVFRTPDERFEGLPGFAFEPHHIDLGGDLAGLRMHYIDEGSGDPILCLHGEPTWSFLYRKMVGPLTDAGRVIAPDLIGFGRSDKVLDRDWYSYEGHVWSLMQFIEALDLADITLVVQDWGGPIGLRVAMEDPDRFARLVILNTGVFRPGPNWPNAAFLAWREFAESNPDLPIGSIMENATSTDLPADVIRAYEAPFPDAASKAGAAAFPLLVPLDLTSPGADKMIWTRERLETWTKPALVAFSDADPIFPQRAGERLAERIPGARFAPVAGASHFLQEDKGEEIAELISPFIKGS